MAKKLGIKTVAQNKRARHDFFVEDSLECGLELHGTEVKSMRQGRVNLKESYAIVKNGEVFVLSMHISPYEQGNIFNVDPMRPRRLLMHKKEILRLLGKIKEQGLTLVPLKAYFKKDKIKIELALAKGKKLYDKREAAAEKSAKREIEKAMKERSRDY